LGRCDFLDEMIERDGSIADARSSADSGVESGRVARTLNSYYCWVAGSNDNHGGDKRYHRNRRLAMSWFSVKRKEDVPR
jgi:hypothetical protein